MGCKLTASNSNGTVFEDAGFIIDQNRRCVQINGRTISLMPLEFLLMLEFVNHINTVLTRKQLLQKVWGTDFMGKSRTVDVHVSSLRKKLGWENYIVTIHRAGYRLEIE